MTRFSNTEVFIKKARKVHGNKYDYSHVKYVDSDSKVCIICPEHGEFWQVARTHLSGSGCPICVGRRKMRTSDYIKKRLLFMETSIIIRKLNIKAIQKRFV